MKKSIGIISASFLLLGSISLGTQAAEAAKCVTVKNVVGKNYQTAQDIWRGQGLWVVPALDGTGRKRTAWNDSNWYVIGQSPKAGKCVKKNSDVRATIKKYTD